MWGVRIQPGDNKKTAPNSGGRVGAKLSKEEREIVLPLGVVVLVVLGVWLWWRRR